MTGKKNPWTFPPDTMSSHLVPAEIQEIEQPLRWHDGILYLNPEIVEIPVSEDIQEFGLELRFMLEWQKLGYYKPERARDIAAEEAEKKKRKKSKKPPTHKARAPKPKTAARSSSVTARPKPITTPQLIAKYAPAPYSVVPCQHVICDRCSGSGYINPDTQTQQSWAEWLQMDRQNSVWAAIVLRACPYCGGSGKRWTL